MIDKIIMYESGIIFYNEKFDAHRIKGPAMSYYNSEEEWYLYGKRHRIDGPAIKYNSGNRTHWIFGKLLKNKPQ